MPLSGGQYFWVYYIAPPSCRTFLSYLTGWINVLGWQAGTTSLSFLAGTMIQGLITLNHPTYVGERWHGTLLLYAVIAITIIINTYLANHMPKIEGLIFILHMVGFFCILIPVVYLAPHGTPKDVFGTFLNEGGWSSDTLSFFVGITTSVFAFLGADSACHMAEEIEGASTIIPWAMVSAISVNGALGFGMLIAVLFCLGDTERIAGTATGFPYIEIFYQATNSIAASTAMSALIVSLVIFGAAACFTTSSRMMWAFARDNGLPFSQYLKRVRHLVAGMMVICD
jgi:choline transport protein